MQERVRHYRPKRPPKKGRFSKRQKKILLLAAVGFVCIALLKYGQSEKPAQQQAQAEPVEVKVDEVAPPSNTIPSIDESIWGQLETELTTAIEQNSSLDISVSVVDILTDTTQSYGNKEPFHGASTTKVLTAAAYLHDVEQGRRTMTQTLGEATAETQIRLMVNRSDNVAWELLNVSVGYSRLNTYAQSIGLGSFNYAGNTMTTQDMASLLGKLYKRELLSEGHTTQLLSYMQNTNNEAMIPAVVTEGTLYHKYGQFEDRLHDVAIIDYKERPIALAIYTKGPGAGTTSTSREQLIQSLAKITTTTLYSSLPE